MKNQTSFGEKNLLWLPPPNLTFVNENDDDDDDDNSAQLRITLTFNRLSSYSRLSEPFKLNCLQSNFPLVQTSANCFRT